MRGLSLFTAALLIGVSGWCPGHALASAEVPGDCTFTIQGNFDGTIVNVTITVSDVNFIECALLKAGVKKAVEQAKK